MYCGSTTLLVAVCALILAAIQAQNVPEPHQGKTALDEYVWAPDANYGWKEMEGHQMQGGGYVRKADGWTAYTLNLTSQQWLTPQTFSNTSSAGSIWWHILVVIIPDEVKYLQNATLYITGSGMPHQNADGSWSGLPSAKDEDIEVAAAIATSSGIITGALFQIPDEHITFADDPIQKSRGEDAIIAYTWAHYLNYPEDNEWLLRFPMVKASLRAMDAITDFVATKKPELNTQLDYYAVAGASKRGWTTWDVGAVDSHRVQAIVPIVLDAINFQQVMHHQYQSYNGWSWALSDYTDMNVMAHLDDDNMNKLASMVDPIYYRNRLTMPKLVVNAVLDEFQQPDDTRYWWNAMPEPKHFIMTPNAEHSEATGILEIVPAIGSFLRHLVDPELSKKKMPEFTWEISEETGEIVATLNEHGLVKEARVWHAYSCGNNINSDGSETKRRDFRMINMDSPCKCGVEANGMCANLKSFWVPKILEQEMVNGKRTYRAQVDAPEDGRWVAYMIEVVYAKNAADALLPDGLPHIIARDLDGRLQFTTEVSVWPNVFPYPGCGVTNGVDTGIECTTNLV